MIFHVAAANLVVGALEENEKAAMSVAGDWAYIPGTWRIRDGVDPARGIPTTYYTAVQLTDTTTVHEEPEAVAASLRRQLRALEAQASYVDALSHGAMVRGVRAIELCVSAFVRGSSSAALAVPSTADAHRRSADARCAFQTAVPGLEEARAPIPYAGRQNVMSVVGGDLGTYVHDCASYPAASCRLRRRCRR